MSIDGTDKLDFKDGTYTKGVAGVRVWNTGIQVFRVHPLPPIQAFSDNFDKNMVSWKVYDGQFDASSGGLVVAPTLIGKAVYPVTFDNLVLEAQVALSKNDCNRGLIFRTSSLRLGEESYHGYYVGIDFASTVVLGRTDRSWTQPQSAHISIVANRMYHLKVRAIDDSIIVFVDNMTTLKIRVNDGVFAAGVSGVLV